MYKKIKKGLKNPLHILEYIQRHYFATWIKNDKTYIKWNYFFGMGRFPNLDNPQTFNEKLQWLKLHDRRPEYTHMVDKYEAKEYVKEILGEEYIIPTLGVWDSFEDIDFETLPDQFVLKCTHDSGGLIICKDKSKLDIKKARKKINRILKKNYFLEHREYPYKDVKPRIIAEKYMTDGDNDLEDYKIHNFNGIPKVILLCRDRFKNSPLIEDFYSTDWQLLDVRRPGHPNSPQPQAPPAELSEMLALSEKLSKKIPFLRTDFYTVEGKVYFGELTLFPAAGNVPFEPEEWDYVFGEWLELPQA